MRSTFRLFVLLVSFFAAPAEAQVISAPSGEAVTSPSAEAVKPSPSGEAVAPPSAEPITPPSEENVTRHETTHVLDCLLLSQVKKEYTPADIYPAIAKCLQEDRYQDATDLFKVAGVYAYFDKLRVADVTAHEAAQALIVDHLAQIDMSKKDTWKVYMDEQSDPANKMFLRACGVIRRLGAPSYYPAYMIGHGTDAAFKTSGKALVVPFNAKKAWNSALDNYLRCPAAPSK